MNNTRKTFLILFFVLLIVGFVAVFWGYYQIYQEVGQADGAEIERLWEQGELDKVIELTTKRLQKNSLNFQLLRYSAYAYFYLALSQTDRTERLLNLDSAVRQLRKALLVGYPNKAVSAEIYYVLGKAYYYQGLSSMPMALKYLRRALDLGYQAGDSYEFLADAYRQLGQETKSLEYFASLFETENPSDRYLLAYGKSLLGAGEYIQAERILSQAQKITQNQLLLAEILLQLAQVYYNDGRWQEAKSSLEEVLSKRESSDAYFLLGEVYSILKQPVRARRKWRQALELDDQYEAAFQRLQNRSG